ncbi:hypothetical protein ACHAPM_003710 [Fusarium culmorum]
MQQPGSGWFDELVDNFADTIHEPEVKIIDESAVDYLLQSWVRAGPQCPTDIRIGNTNMFVSRFQSSAITSLQAHHRRAWRATGQTPNEEGKVYAHSAFMMTLGSISEPPTEGDNFQFEDQDD